MKGNKTQHILSAVIVVFMALLLALPLVAWDGAGWDAGGGSGNLTRNPAWTAAGQLVQGTGANTGSIMPVGSNGQVWKSNGTLGGWAADATGLGGDQLVDVVATAPLKVNGTTHVNDALPGTDADVTLSIAGTTTGTFLHANGTNYVDSAYTLPTAAGAAGIMMYSNGTNYVNHTNFTVSAAGNLDAAGSGTFNAGAGFICFI